MVDLISHFCFTVVVFCCGPCTYKFFVEFTCAQSAFIYDISWTCEGDLTACGTGESGRKFPVFWETWIGASEAGRKFCLFLGDLNPEHVIRILARLEWLESM